MKQFQMRAVNLTKVDNFSALLTLQDCHQLPFSLQPFLTNIYALSPGKIYFKYSFTILSFENKVVKCYIITYAQK